MKMDGQRFWKDWPVAEWNIVLYLLMSSRIEASSKLKQEGAVPWTRTYLAVDQQSIIDWQGFEDFDSSRRSHFQYHGPGTEKWKSKRVKAQNHLNLPHSFWEFSLRHAWRTHPKSKILLFQVQSPSFQFIYNNEIFAGHFKFFPAVFSDGQFSLKLSSPLLYLKICYAALLFDRRC